MTFNGNGYATADTIWRRRARFRSLIIDVKTFDHNSLLVVCPNPEKVRSKCNKCAPCGIVHYGTSLYMYTSVQIKDFMIASSGLVVQPYIC